MFGTNKKTGPVDLERVDTLIGKNTCFEGIIKGEGTIRLDGKIIGEVIVSGNVVVGEGGSIKGNVTADNVHSAGIVEGNITANSQLHLTSTSKLVGDMTVKNVVIDEGAVFSGSCKMITEVQSSQVQSIQNTTEVATDDKASKKNKE